MGARSRERSEDERLVALIRKGDRQAFDRLVIQYQGRVYYTALRILHQHDEALDVAQDVFLKVWMQIRSLKRGVKVYCWLYRITVNTCLDRLRWRKRHPASPLSEQDVVTIPEWRYETSPRQLLEEAMWKRRVETALERLPAKQKAVFVLRHYQNLKLREIAEILDRPLGTIKATLHQAVYRLRAEIPQEDLLPVHQSDSEPDRKAEEV